MAFLTSKEVLEKAERNSLDIFDSNEAYYYDQGFIDGVEFIVNTLPEGIELDFTDSDIDKLNIINGVCSEEVEVGVNVGAKIETDINQLETYTGKDLVEYIKSIIKDDSMGGVVNLVLNKGLKNINLDSIYVFKEPYSDGTHDEYTKVDKTKDAIKRKKELKDITDSLEELQRNIKDGVRRKDSPTNPFISPYNPYTPITPYNPINPFMPYVSYVDADMVNKSINAINNQPTTTL